MHREYHENKREPDREADKAKFSRAYESTTTEKQLLSTGRYLLTAAELKIIGEHPQKYTRVILPRKGVVYRVPPSIMNKFIACRETKETEETEIADLFDEEDLQRRTDHD